MEGYMFDYRLGYVRSGCSLPGFDILGEGEKRIVALGGYTTPSMAISGSSWAHALLEKTDGSVQIYNGCTDGYSSAQILTMLIRDVILLKPDVVVCLSGFHNIAYKLGLVPNKADAGLLRAHPFATPMQIRFLRNITSRFGLGKGDIYYGEENLLPAWEIWLRHMAEMKAVCDAFGMVFKACLQPSVFSGKYVRNARENAFLRAHYGLSDDDIIAFHLGFKREYDEIAQRASGLSYIVDLTGKFDGYADAYDDEYHIKEELLLRLTEDML